jgi:hypothetical protein
LGAGERKMLDELVAVHPGTLSRAELIAGERRGLALRFRPGPSAALIFCVEAGPAVGSPTPFVGAPLVGAQRNPAPPRTTRRRQTATERYHEVLPRWMPVGQQPDRPSGASDGKGGRQRPAQPHGRIMSDVWAELNDRPRRHVCIVATGKS